MKKIMFLSSILLLNTSTLGAMEEDFGRKRKNEGPASQLTERKKVKFNEGVERKLYIPLTSEEEDSSSENESSSSTDESEESSRSESEEDKSSDSEDSSGVFGEEFLKGLGGEQEFPLPTYSPLSEKRVDKSSSPHLTIPVTEGDEGPFAGRNQGDDEQSSSEEDLESTQPVEQDEEDEIKRGKKQSPTKSAERIYRGE